MDTTYLLLLLVSIPHLNPPISDSIDATDVLVMVDKANADQRAIIYEIMNLVLQNDTSKADAYFIDGPGGTGRTYVYKCLIYLCML